MGNQSSCCEEELEEVPKEVIHHRHDFAEGNSFKTCLPGDAAHESEETDESASASAGSPRAVDISLAQCRLQRMDHLVVDQEILRGITLRESLQDGGRLWRRSPLDLKEPERKGLWSRCRARTDAQSVVRADGRGASPGSPQEFSIAHDDDDDVPPSASSESAPSIPLGESTSREADEAPGMQKMMQEAFPMDKVQNGLGAAKSWVSWGWGSVVQSAKKAPPSAGCFFVPGQSFGRLWRWSPLDLREEDRKKLWQRSKQVPGFDTFLILGTTSSLLGLLGSVYVPNSVSRSEVCFLDVVSIHQTDAQLMERGIYGLGGFLKVAKDPELLWSPPYLSRLWCVFELAAYRTANPEGKITLNPLFIESLCGIMFLGNLAGSVLYTTMQLRKMSQNLGEKIVQLRRHLALGLSNFKLSEAECRNDFDREFIYSGIIQWYGSLEAFTAYVRKSLRMELIGCAYFQLRIPPGYLLLICIGPVSASLEGFLALLKLGDTEFGGMMKGEAPAEVLMRYLIGRVLATDLCWQLFALKLMLTLCDTLGARPWPGLLNCVKSLLIFMVFCACSIVGGAIGEAFRRVSQATDLAVNKAAETMTHLDQEIQSGIAVTEDAIDARDGTYDEVANAEYLFWFAGFISVQMTMFFARGADSHLGHGWNVSQAIYVFYHVEDLSFKKGMDDTSESFVITRAHWFLRSLFGFTINLLLREFIGYSVPILLMLRVQSHLFAVCVLVLVPETTSVPPK
eukprot:g19891.t1